MLRPSCRADFCRIRYSLVGFVLGPNPFVEHTYGNMFVNGNNFTATGLGSDTAV